MNKYLESTMELEFNNTIDSGLERLLEIQEFNIKNADEKIKTFTKYKKDYEELKRLLHTIKDRVRYPHKIPLAGSQLALVSGEIIHTNEIMVLLGDNYFALRSSKQAEVIVDRRLDNIKRILSGISEEKRKTLDWLKATQEHKSEKEQFVEIIEKI